MEWGEQRTEDRDGVPSRRHSTAKGTAQAAAFPDTQTTVIFPFDNP